MSALVQVATITVALVQVAAITSALIQLGCYHWCSSTVGCYHQCSIVQEAAIIHRQGSIVSGMLEVCMKHHGVMI